MSFQGHFGQLPDTTIQWIKDHYGQKVPEHTIITYTDGTTSEIVCSDGALTYVLTKGDGNQIATNTTIQSVEIGSDTTSIEDSAFWGCTGLTSITIPSSVTSIGVNTFGNCSSLTSITIPSSVTSIKLQAFSGCSSLTSITIPSSATSIGNDAFQGCSSLTNIILENRTLDGAQALIGTTNPLSYTGTVTYDGGTYKTTYTVAGLD